MTENLPFDWRSFLLKRSGEWAGTRLFEGVPPRGPERVTSRSVTLVTRVTYRALS